MDLNTPAEIDTEATKIAAQIARLTRTADLLAARYIRAPWTRYYAVPGGHVHSSTSCSSCYPTTQFLRVDVWAGRTAADLVEAAGERACTVCFPWAPVETRTRPSTVWAPEESDARQAADARRAELDAKRAARDAKSITTRDGDELLDNHGMEIKTERSAQIEYVDMIVRAMDLRAMTAEEWDVVDRAERLAYWANLAAEYDGHAARILDALAAKHGVSVDVERATLAPKITARRKRDEREVKRFQR